MDCFYQPNLGRLLVIYGGNGTGKTHTAKQARRWFAAVQSGVAPVVRDGAVTTRSYLYANWPETVDGFKRDQWAIVDRLMTEHLVILDDIGAEHDPSKLGAEKLYLILNRRERRYTVITTNIPPAEWEARFERRIASRLFRNAVHVDLSDVPDYNV